MANKDSQPHLYIGNNGSRHPISKSGGGGSKPLPRVNRGGHVERLSGNLQKLLRYEEGVREEPLTDEVDRIGLQVTFESFEGFELAFDSLANVPAGIELLNIQFHNNIYYATVFVPEGKLTVFQKKLEKYAETADQDSPAQKKLIESIASFHRATIRALWTDSLELFPTSEVETFSWEVWLVKGDGAPERDFRRLAEILDIWVSERRLEFRERVVIYVNASLTQLTSSAHLLNAIAELKKPKETAEFFNDLTIEEQREWADELLSRLNDSRNDSSPTVTILDTGVNIGHKLIAPFSSQQQMFTVNPAFGTADTDGHGTNMTGIAVYGDLKDALATQNAIDISHSIESVKVINSGGDNRDQAYGAITIDATTAPETSRPGISRIFTMAISATDTRDKGRPSAWSAAIDELCFNRLGDQDPKRLFIIAAGNSELQQADFTNYPDCLSVQLIHDPGQSWNALTVGAYTEKVSLTDPKQGAPLAAAGEVSPYTSTSVGWENQKPIKPDVVFEGGNVAVNELGGVTHESLSLLTTDHDVQARQFTTFWATSASTALAAQFAARLYVRYPDFRPETIRALIVHSASWTNALYQQFAPNEPPKRKAAALMRRVGYGVPNIDKALDSASQRVSVVIEDEIAPFQKKGSSVTLNEMVLHDLPWPREILQELGSMEVRLTATLSYFIEPNPSNRAFASKYSYQSHNLEFDLKRALETPDQLIDRINTGSRPPGYISQGDTGDWLIGPQNRAHGSISKDVWTGTASDLAERDKIAIIPSSGWWKTRTPLKMHGETTRYSLILTIEAPETDVDIYSAIKTLIEADVVTPVDVSI